MKDIDRNTRTLIICFVVAVFSLVPLRFYEVGMQSEAQQAYVLGLSDQADQMSLPDSQIQESSQPVLEYPYEEVEKQALTSNCLDQQEADRQIEALVEVLKTESLAEETVTAIVDEISKIEGSVCK